MSNKVEKPKCLPTQLVKKMRDEKGITFIYVSETDAATFLEVKNNYIRTAAYRKVYPKYTAGTNAGKYIGLDFGCLKELSILDMHYRFLVEEMCSDIERALCEKINKMIDNDQNTDGYEIVKNFLNANTDIVATISRASTSPHTGALIQKYFTVSLVPNSRRSGSYIQSITAYDDCPAWVLTEVMTFGDIIRFYYYYCNNYNVRSTESRGILNTIRMLRNGAAHNNCLLSDLSSASSTPPTPLVNALMRFGTLTRTQINKKLCIRTVEEFVALMYEYDRLVIDEVRKHRIEQLKDLFFTRFLEKKDFFVNNQSLVSTYEFCRKVIEGFFP